MPVAEDASSIELRDGRALSYSDRGDRSGRPLLYFHGNPGSRLDWCAGEYERAIADAAVRWIGVDRPGFGRSDFTGPTRYESWAGDVVELMDRLELERAPILAYSRGALFALACAALIPDRVTTAGLLSAVAPGDWPGMTRSLRRDTRAGLSMICRSERLGRAMMAFPVARIRRSEAGTVAELNRLLRSPHDRSLLRAHAGSWRTSMVEAFRQGPAAYVSEGRTWVAPLSFDLGSVRAPVVLWHGEEDRLIPISHARYLAVRLPDASLHVIPEEGHGHPPHVLAAIASELVEPTVSRAGAPAGYSAPMPGENVEVVRRFKEAINAGDSDVWAALVAPDFEFRSVFVGVEGRVYRGPEGGVTYLADLAEAFDHVHIEIQDMQDLGDDRVLTLMRVHTRGRASGAETDVPLASIARVHDGKIATYQSYTDLGEARRVAGV